MSEQMTVSQEGFETIDDYKPDEQLTLFNMQELAIKHDLSLSELKRKLREANQMYKDTLDADAGFREVAKRVKTTQEQKTEVKSTLDSMPSVASQLQVIKDIKEEIKEKKVVISDYATSVIRMSGKTQFEKDGETYDVITVAKLVKRKQ